MRYSFNDALKTDFLKLLTDAREKIEYIMQGYPEFHSKNWKVLSDINLKILEFVSLAKQARKIPKKSDNLAEKRGDVTHDKIEDFTEAEAFAEELERILVDYKLDNYIQSKVDAFSFQLRDILNRPRQKHWLEL